MTEPACWNLKGHEARIDKHQNQLKQNSEENNKEEPNLCRACWDAAGRAGDTLVPLRHDPHTVRELCDDQVAGQANLPHGFEDAQQNHLSTHASGERSTWKNGKSGKFHILTARACGMRSSLALKGWIGGTTATTVTSCCLEVEQEEEAWGLLHLKIRQYGHNQHSALKFCAERRPRNFWYWNPKMWKDLPITHYARSISLELAN